MKTLQILADPSSLMKNITKFFSDPYAHIQEMLQNARRAEATEVVVDITPDKITISDNGHGVYDPQRLITIGGSEWKDKVSSEIPAGMGLFSCFQIAETIVVRSADWSLRLNYELLCKGMGPQLEEGLPVIKGTVLELLYPAPNGQDLTHTISTDIIQYHPQKAISRTPISRLVEKWANTALFMPFTTRILVEGGNNPHAKEFTPKSHIFNSEDDYQEHLFEQNEVVVEKFDLGLINPKTHSKKFPWGEIRVSLEDNIRRYKGKSQDRVKVVTQGICLEEKGNIPPQVDLVIFIEPGHVDLRLPDRNCLITNEKTNKILAEAKDGIADVLVKMINSSIFESMEERWLGSALLELSPSKMGLIDKDKRCVRVSDGNRRFIVSVEQVLESKPHLVLSIYDQLVLEAFTTATFYKLSDYEGRDAFIEGLDGRLPVYDYVRCDYRFDKRAVEDEGVIILQDIWLENEDGRETAYVDADLLASVLYEKSDITWEDLDDRVTYDGWVLVHNQPESVPQDPEMTHFYNADHGDSTADDAWEEHPIRTFLMNLCCDTFYTSGNPRDIENSLSKYTEGKGKLLECSISFKYGDLHIESGILDIDGKRQPFINDSGVAHMVEEPETAPF